MLGILTDDHGLAMSLDDLALFANSFDGRLNFHYLTLSFQKLLLLSPGDAALGNIVGRYLHGHHVTDENLDIVHTQLPGDRGSHDVSVRKLYLEDGVGESLHNLAIFKFNQIGFRQNLSS